MDDLQGYVQSASVGAQASDLTNGNYIVKEGDCIESIAEAHGLLWKTIWNHPDNRDLRELRKNPNVLFAGDMLFVPDKKPKDETGATEQRHRFRRKGAPSKLHIRVLQTDGKPKGNVEYILDIEGALYKGTTTADGWIRRVIVPNAKTGKLVVVENGKFQELPLKLGYLDPVDKIAGVQQRLKNLGFDCGVEDGKVGDNTRVALRDFQRQYGLLESGEADEATRENLRRVHGS